MPASPMIPIPTADERPLLTIRETAEILGVSLNTAYLAAQRGDLPVLRVGRQYRVQTAELRTAMGLDQSEPVELPARHPRLPISRADRIREAKERRAATVAAWQEELLDIDYESELGGDNDDESSER